MAKKMPPSFLANVKKTKAKAAGKKTTAKAKTKAKSKKR